MSEKVYGHVRRGILDGLYEPGTALPEHLLARANGTSRTPVREALSRLMAEGYVERRGGRGFLVAGFTIKGLNDTFEVRKIVESAAAALAAERATAEQRRRLPDLATFKYVVGDHDSYQQAREMNACFHRLVALASQNGLLLELVNHCLNQMSRFLALGFHLPNKFWQSADQEHHLLAAAIAAGDAGEASRVMAQHLEHSNQLLMEALIDSEAAAAVGCGFPREREGVTATIPESAAEVSLWIP